MENKMNIPNSTPTSTETTKPHPPHTARMHRVARSPYAQHVLQKKSNTASTPFTEGQVFLSKRRTNRLSPTVIKFGQVRSVLKEKFSQEGSLGASPPEAAKRTLDFTSDQVHESSGHVVHVETPTRDRTLEQLSASGLTKKLERTEQKAHAMQSKIDGLYSTSSSPVMDDQLAEVGKGPSPPHLRTCLDCVAQRDEIDELREELRQAKSVQSAKAIQDKEFMEHELRTVQDTNRVAQGKLEARLRAVESERDTVLARSEEQKVLVESLKKQLEDAWTQRDAARASQERVTDEKETLTRENVRLENKLIRQEATSQTESDIRYRTMKQERDELASRATELEASLARVEGRYEEKLSMIESVMTKNGELSALLRAEKEKLAIEQERKQQAEDDLLGEIDAMKDRIARLTSEHDRALQEEKDSRAQQVAEMMQTTQLEEAERTCALERGLRSEIDDLTKRAETSEIALLDAQRDWKIERKRLNEQYEGNLREMEENLDVWKQRESQMQREMHIVRESAGGEDRERIAQLTEQVQQTVDRCEDYRSKLKAANQRVEKLQEQVAALNERIQSNETLRQLSSEEITSSINERDEAMARVDEVSQARDAALAKLKQAQDEKGVLQERSRQLKQRLASASQDLEKQQAQATSTALNGNTAPSGLGKVFNWFKWAALGSLVLMFATLFVVHGMVAGSFEVYHGGVPS